MKIEREYPHFKGDHLTRCEIVERFVVDELVNSPLKDEERDSSRAWELMHSSTCKAFMHVLAEKRGCDAELARIAGALHDYYVIKTGKYKDHAKQGGPLVSGILARLGRFSDQEITLVREMVECHSDKDIYTEKAHVELLKDADVFDCSLYHGTEFYYLTKKPLPVCREYFDRILKVRSELGMPLPDAYRSLEKSSGICDVPELGGPQHYARLGPTIPLIALWALAGAAPSKHWPFVGVFFNGQELRWLSPKSEMENLGSMQLPTWSSIEAMKVGVRTSVEKMGRSSRTHDIAGALETARDFLSGLQVPLLSAPTIRRRAGHALADYHCDLSADAMVNELAEGSGARSATALPRVRGWDLDSEQQHLVDQLARLKALEELRAHAQSSFGDILTTMGSAFGKDLLRKFPSDEFGGEPCDLVESGEPWLGVAWPRFKRFEFWKGNEALSRCRALEDYFGQSLPACSH